MCVWWGAVAQLGERLVRNEEVSGSIPLSSTKISPGECKGGSSSVAERQLPKLNVAGSIPVSRSILIITYLSQAKMMS